MVRQKDMHSFSSESNVTLSTSIKIFNKLLYLQLTEMRKSSGRQMTHSVGADTVTSLFFKSEQSDIIQYQENCQAFFYSLALHFLFVTHFSFHTDTHNTCLFARAEIHFHSILFCVHPKPKQILSLTLT